MMNLPRTSRALALIAVTALIASETHLAASNKTKPCNEIGCRKYETCNLDTGKCTLDNGDCITTPCKNGFYCNDLGKCIEDKCDQIQIEKAGCGPQQECFLEHVQCFVDPCPPNPSCRTVDRCASVKCPDGEECENGQCVLDSKCAVTLCKPDTYCYKGSCLRSVECAENQCGPAEKCYVGEEACSHPPCPSKTLCRFDKCAVVRCAGCHECKDGKCIKIENCPYN